MRVLNGFSGAPQDLMQGANTLMQNGVQDKSWPYWWLQPRQGTQYFPAVNSIPAPANNAVTEVLALEVPAGFVYVMIGYRHTFQSGVGGVSPFVDGSGDILWTIDVDNPVGSVSLSNYGLPGMTNMADQRGSQLGPWPVTGYQVFDPYQTIRYKVITTAAIPPDAPNFITCGIFGWFDKLL